MPMLCYKDFFLHCLWSFVLRNLFFCLSLTPCCKRYWMLSTHSMKAYMWSSELVVTGSIIVFLTLFSVYFKLSMSIICVLPFTIWYEFYIISLWWQDVNLSGNNIRSLRGLQDHNLLESIDLEDNEVKWTRLVISLIFVFASKFIIICQQSITAFIKLKW